MLSPANPLNPIGPAPTGHAWESVSGKTFSWRIAQQIKEALLSRQLMPGARLGTESAIAESFGVSRMAARDALRSLQAMGVLEIKVGKQGGVYVAKANSERLLDAFAIQLVLIGVSPQELLDAQVTIEMASIGLAAANSTAEDIAQLQEKFERFRGAVNDKDPATFDRFAPEVIGLHEGLVSASRNRVLISQFGALRALLEPIYVRAIEKQSPVDIEKAIQRVLATHGPLLDCIEAHDQGGAQALLRPRLNDLRQVTLAAMMSEHLEISPV